jgi:hypothetical protein
MAVLEIAKVLRGISQLHGRPTWDRGGDNDVRAASTTGTAERDDVERRLRTRGRQRR